MMKSTLVALILLNALTAVLLVRQPVNHKAPAKKQAVVHKKVAKKAPVKKAPVKKAAAKKTVVRRRNTDNDAADSWASKTQETSNTQGATKGVAHGNGKSQSAAGPKGAQSQAEGCLGTETGSSYNADSARDEDSWGQSSKGKNASSFSNKTNNKEQIAAAAHGASKKKGSSGAAATTENSQAYGNGGRGASSGASWGQSKNANEDKYAANSSRDNNNRNNNRNNKRGNVVIGSTH